MSGNYEHIDLRKGMIPDLLVRFHKKETWKIEAEIKRREKEISEKKKEIIHSERVITLLRNLLDEHNGFIIYVVERPDHCPDIDRANHECEDDCEGRPKPPYHCCINRLCDIEELRHLKSLHRS